VSKPWALKAAPGVTLQTHGLTHKLENILKIASLCRDTVDMYVSASEAEGFGSGLSEDLILAHPLMQEELRRQREDARELAAFMGNHAAADILKKRWRDQAKSNIGLRVERRD
jgi:hypothetical protein